MTPLTLDCARVRQLQGALHDGELEGDELAFVTGHMDTCEGCQQAWTELQGALAALAALSPEDIAQLRGLPSEPELDTRPLSHAVLGGVLLLLLIVTGGALVARSQQKPAAAPVQQVLPSLPLPLIGGEVGLEHEQLAVAPPPPVAEPVEVAVARPAPAMIPDVFPEPAPAIVPEAKPEPVVAAVPGPMKQKPKKPAVKPQVLPAPLPDRAKETLERLRLAQGLSYRGVTFYFVQDPEGRDRLASPRRPALPTVREASPSVPETVEARAAGRRELVLAGELLDAPLGLRIATETLPYHGRTRIAVKAVNWEGLAPRNQRRDALLKTPVLVPSAARYALLKDAQPGAVAVLLGQLTHNAFTEVQRLRLELNRIEPEARQLEQRLRARVRNTRGLRGLAITVDGRPRFLEVFANAREFAHSLGVLLRSALLESHLKFFGPEDPAQDWAAARILGGENQTRAQHQNLLAFAAASRKSERELPSRKIDGLYMSLPTDEHAVSRVTLQKGRVLHALVVVAGAD